MPDAPDERPPLTVAMEWASRITNVALEMVVPAAIGYGLDRWLGTHVALTAVGAILGFVLGMRSLIRVARLLERRDSRGRSSDRKRD